LAFRLFARIRVLDLTLCFTVASDQLQSAPKGGKPPNRRSIPEKSRPGERIADLS
jgi:hypothetical protein